MSDLQNVEGLYARSNARTKAGESGVGVPLTISEGSGLAAGLAPDNAGLARQPEVPYMVDVDEDPRAYLERLRASALDAERKATAHLEAARGLIRKLDAAIAALGSAEATPAQMVGEEPRLTIKQAVMRILEPISPRGLSALGILERLRVDFDMTYPRESLSPQLSRLKKEGRVRLEGGIWYASTKQNGPGE